MHRMVNIITFVMAYSQYPFVFNPQIKIIKRFWKKDACFSGLGSFANMPATSPEHLAVKFPSFITRILNRELEP